MSIKAGSLNSIMQNYKKSPTKQTRDIIRLVESALYLTSYLRVLLKIVPGNIGYRAATAKRIVGYVCV